MKKRIIAFVLSIVLLFSLTACGEDETFNSENPSQSSQSETARSKYAYKPTYLSMDCEGVELQYIGDFCVSGDTVFFYGECVTGEEPWIDEFTGEPVLDENGEPYMNPVLETKIFKLELTTGQVSALTGYTPAELPEGVSGYRYVNSFSAGEDGTIWISEMTNTYSYDLPEDFDPATDNAYDYYTQGESKNILYQLDYDGNELQAIELELPESGSFNNLILADNGEIYATDWENILFYDASGKLKSTLPVEHSINTLVDLGAGRIALSVWKEDGNYLIDIDTAAMALGAESKLDANAYILYPGMDEYAYLYDNNGTIYGHKEADGTNEKIFSWLDCDVDNSYFYGIMDILEDGRVFTVESIYDDQTAKNSYNLVMMEQVDPSTVPVKQELTLACFYLDWDLRSDIVEFNKTHDDVRIVVNEYSQYATEEDYYAGLQKLNTEIMSGMAPDLFLLNSSMPVDQYAAKGILMDLWPLIDSDPELSREDLMTHFFDALSVDGKLYQIVDSFGISTVAAKESVVGSGKTWTLDDLMTILEQQPEGTTIFGNYDTKESILNSCIARSAESFIDWNTLQCSFDSEEFIDMLTFANQFPVEINYDKMIGEIEWAVEESEASLLRSGKQLLYRAGIYSFDSLQWANQVFGEKANFIGYPTMSNNGSCFEISGGLAISSSCANVDAAWSFIRTYLTEEHQTQEYMYQFPTNKHSFDELAKRAMTPVYEIDPETGEERETPVNFIWYNENEEVEIYAMTQEELDLFMEIYNNCTSFYSYNEEINELIVNETEAFFNGQKTAEETAKLIQDRVGLYVFENG